VRIERGVDVEDAHPLVVDALLDLVGAGVVHRTPHRFVDRPHLGGPGDDQIDVEQEPPQLQLDRR
jgi:hypothetical protein